MKTIGTVNMTDNYLEKIYSPSMWSKRFLNSEEVIKQHTIFTQKESEQNRKCYQHKTISYDNDGQESIDIYFNKNEENSSIFAYVHGGYWQALTKEESAYCVQPIVENGYRCAVVGYELCPKRMLSEVIESIKKAFRVLFDYATKTNAKLLTLCGHSAGAHLIASSLSDPEFYNSVQNNIIKSVILISGVYDLTELWKVEAVNCNNILHLDKDTAKNQSPMFNDFKYLKNIGLKFYIIVGEYDSPKFIEQSQLFNRNLCDLQLDSHYHLIRGRDHFDIVENLSKIDFEITQIALNSLKENEV